MQYTVETSMYNFPAWSGGKDTLDEIKEADKCEELEELIEEQFYDETPSDTAINDFLWFERDYIYERLGLTSDEDDEEDEELLDDEE